MPSLLRLAGEPSPAAKAVRQMSKTVEEALATAEAANYRIDILLAPPAAPGAEEVPEPEEEPQQAEPVPTQVAPEPAQAEADQAETEEPDTQESR